MKLVAPIIASAALVGIIAVSMSTRPTALSQGHLVRAAALDDIVLGSGEALPQFLLDYLANPRNPATIDYAWDQLVPIAMHIPLTDPVEPLPIDAEAKSEQAKFDCVFTNRAGTKWCVTVTYTCENGMVVPGNPTISDCTDGWHLPYTWNVSIDKTGKVSMSLTTLTIHTTKTVCRYAPECEC